MKKTIRTEVVEYQFNDRDKLVKETRTTIVTEREIDESLVGEPEGKEEP